MAQRNSTLAQTNQGYDGANKSNAGFKTIPEELTTLLDSTTPESVDPVTYGVINSYFLSNGASPRNAMAMTLLIFDSAKIEQTSPLKMLGKMNNSNDISLSETLMYTINVLNSTTSRIGTASTKNNNKSYKARYIRA